MVEAPRLNSGSVGNQSSFSPSFFASLCRVSHCLVVGLLNGLVVEAVVRREVCVFAGQDCALKVEGNSVERHPGLFAFGLLSARLELRRRGFRSAKW